MNKLQELITLKDKAIAGETRTHIGICGHLSFNIKLEHLKTWPGYSGCKNYPINDKYSGLNPVDQFDDLEHWEGRQLEERLSLLNHLIECYKAEAKKLQELIALKGKVLAGEQENRYGVCDQLTFCIKEEYLKTWSGFSGDTLYPVYVEEQGRNPILQYITSDKWEGRQLEERLSLLNHLIECYSHE